MAGTEIFTGIPERRFQELLDRFGDLRIAVLGDFFLDKYLEVDPRLAETSLETGKVAHQVVRIRHSPGAAGTIVANLASLGAGRIYALGFTGTDGEGEELRSGLREIGCDDRYLLHAPNRRTPTYLKPRDVDKPGLAGEHNRYDIKNREWLPAEIEVRLLNALEHLLPTEVDAVIVSDQVVEEECGVVTNVVRRRLEELARRWSRVTFWVDSRARIDRYRFAVTKPNQFEAVGWTNPPDGATVPLSRLRAAARRLRKHTEAPVVVTCGERGALVSDPGPTLVPAYRVKEPIDPTGAGDSFTAAAVLALAAGGTLPEAALFGNLAASLTIQQLATTGTALRRDLPERYRQWLEQQGSRP
ncbi:MAG: bifunctional ADP-heptose synthase [Acidobacteriota bacterium]